MSNSFSSLLNNEFKSFSSMLDNEFSSKKNIINKTKDKLIELCSKDKDIAEFCRLILFYRSINDNKFTSEKEHLEYDVGATLIGIISDLDFCDKEKMFLEDLCQFIEEFFIDDKSHMVDLYLNDSNNVVVTEGFHLKLNESKKVGDYIDIAIEHNLRWHNSRYY